MKVREGIPRDARSIERLHLEAFGPEEGPAVSLIGTNLLARAVEEPTIIFVAEEDCQERTKQIVGSVFFSDFRISQHPQVCGSILSPLAVIPHRQRAGIGSLLVKHGLSMMAKKGIDVVLVYGDPQYYTRFGFSINHQIIAPYRLRFPDGWMACELKSGVLASTFGTATCVSSLRNPDLW